MMTLRLGSLILLPLTLALSAGCSSRVEVQEPMPGIIVKNPTDKEQYNIVSFCEDQEGYIWMNCSRNGVLRNTGGCQVQYLSSSESGAAILSDLVSTMVRDSRGELWLGTASGVNRFDYQAGTFSEYPLEEEDNYILALYEDNNGNFFALTNRSVYRYDPEADDFQHAFRLPLRKTTARYVPMVDRMNKTWLRYDNHIICYDAFFKPFRVFDFRANVENFSYDGGDRVFFTLNGELHVLDIMTLEERIFTEIPSGQNVRSILTMKDHALLIYTEKDAWFWMAEREALLPGTDSRCPYHTLLDLLPGRAYFEDSRGLLWLSDQKGGYTVQNNMSADLETEMGWLEGISLGSVLGAKVNDIYYWQILEDGRILVYDMQKEEKIGETTLRHLVGSPVASPMLRSFQNGRILLQGMFTNEGWTLTADGAGWPEVECHYTADVNFVADIDANGNMWASSSGGEILQGVRESPSLKEVTLVGTGMMLANTFSFPDRVNLLPDGSFLILQTDNHPHLVHGRTIRDLCPENPAWQVYYTASVVEDDGNVWIGTNLHGLFYFEAKSAALHSVPDFSRQEIHSILADESGNLFVLSSSGTGKKRISLRKAGQDSWIPLWEIDDRYSDPVRLLTLPDGAPVARVSGRLYSLTGIEQLVRHNWQAPKMMFLTTGEDLLLMRRIEPKDVREERILLDKLPQNFNLYLSLQDYAGGEPYKVVYNINGFKNGFQTTFNNSAIPLYGLTFGRNKVQLKVQSLDGTWESEPLAMNLFLRRPAWHYWMLALVLFLSGLVLKLVSLFRKRQVAAEKERRNWEIQEMINAKNMDFYSNISHEFRSPLTLINGATTTLENTESPEEEKVRSVQIIRRNTNRMLKLISQLLDFNKLDNKVMELHVAAENLSGLILSVAESFQVGAIQKNIDLLTFGTERPLIAWIDADKMEKVLYNLLSNAMKFTPPGGQIQISLTEADGEVEIAVSDTGIGIPEGMEEIIFQKFVQGDEARRNGGTGIGLYYAQSLIGLHHGSIRAENWKDEKMGGACFRVRIPILPEAYTDQEKKKEMPDRQTVAEPINRNGEYVHETGSTVMKPGRPTILLIDDDYEFVYYLKSVLNHEYNVAFRFDAMSGYKVIEEINPDVIISDIMMMDMDGLQLCRMIKENLLISHIPVIMLTAKSTVEDQIKSLDVGAEAFLTKPFNPEHLLALVRTTISNRRRVMALLSSSTTTPPKEEQKTVLGERDRVFIGKVYECMESSLKEGELNIDNIVAQLGISRTKLFYKIKSLTGQTPNDFFNTYRLNYAAKLLRMNKYKVSAIAEAVGFNSSSHFTTLFKKQFGVLPRQYMDEPGPNQECE